jgi:transcriptional regulator with XRE-family HTH domain
MGRLRKSIYTPEQKALQTLLKACRMNAGLTQEQLAELLGVPPSRISDYERGGRRLDLPQLKTYVEAMGVPITVFVQRFSELCADLPVDQLP